MSVYARWRAWRLERAQLRLADVEHEVDRWGWSYTPSHAHRQRKRVERARRKVVALGGDSDV